MIPEQLPEPLRAMGAYPQWIVWELIATPPGEKDKKIPIDPATRHAVSAQDPRCQFDFATARMYAQLLGLNVGFAFTDNDPFFFVDVDSAYVDGAWSDVARSVFEWFPGAAFEVSASGIGFHLFGTYEGEFPDHKNRRDDIGLEVYHTQRFVAMTFTNMQGDAGTLLTLRFDAFAEQELKRDAAEKVSKRWNPTGPVPSATPIVDDAELIERMCRDLGLPGKAAFRDFWGPDIDALGAAFPTMAGGKAFDGNAADLSMASMLSFWTGKDAERTRGIMMASPYADERSWKWDARPDYLEETVMMAINGPGGVYSVDSSTPVAAAAPAALGFRFITPDQFAEYFAGCTYIVDRNKILMGNGEFLSSEQFRAVMGGHNFALDMDSGKDTDNAFKVFTEGHAWPVPRPQVWSTLFRPGDPPGSRYNARGELESNGSGFANTYVVPPDVVSIPGDVSPFLDLLATQIPDERDRLILLCYMAAVVQYPGVKFQWAPFIQSTPGNGKTFSATAVRHAVGKRYCHTPNAQNLDNPFNAWLEGKIFISAEDVGKRHDIAETLKPMITNRDLAFTPKAVDERSGENTANFMFMSNHQDAIRKTNDDRRFAVFFCAQQHKGDLQRDGMVGGYFPNLWKWFDGGGFAHTTHFLQNYKIAEEFNPATLCVVAPETTSTAAAITASRNTIEQLIVELVEEGAPGFCRGWVSLTCLKARAADYGRTGPHGLSSALEALGYAPHPGVYNGRSSKPIMIDGGARSKLYLKAGHPAAALKGAQVTEAYIKAQAVSEDDEHGTGIMAV